METRYLQEFIVFARLLNYSKAASELYLSAPALRGHIESLENTIGVPLTSKDGQDIILTEAGNILVEKSTGILDATQQVIEACIESNKELFPISVGTAGFSHFEQLLREASILFSARNKGKKALIKSQQSLICYPEALQEKKIDLTLVTHGVDNEKDADNTLISEEFSSSLLYCVKILPFVTKSNPLFYKETLELSDLNGKTFLFSHDIYDAAKRDRLREKFAAAGCQVEIAWRPFPDYNEYFMYDFKDYIGVVPEELVSRHEMAQRKDCRLFSLKDFDWVVGLYLVWEKESSSPELDSFISILHELTDKETGFGKLYKPLTIERNPDPTE